MRRMKLAFEPHLKAINVAYQEYFRYSENVEFKLLDKPVWKSKYKILLPFKFILFFIKAFAQYIYKYDLVHINSAKSGFVAYIASFCGARYIYTIHGCPYPELEKGEGKFKYILCTLEIFFMKIVSKRAVMTYTISKFSQQEIFKNYNINTKVIYNGYNNKIFKYDEDARQAIRKKLNLNENSIVFISVGRLIDYKNPLQVLMSFYEYSKINHDSYIIFVGSGILEDSLRQVINRLGINDNVIIINSINNEELYKYYSACDYFISGCLCEGFGLVALEALACNVIPLLPEKGAFPEIFEDKCFFYDNCIKLVSKKDIEPRANEILTKYKWENIVSKYEQEYLSILKK